MTTFLHAPIILSGITAAVSGLFRQDSNPLRLMGGPSELKPITTETSSPKRDPSLDFLASYTVEAQADYIRDLPGLNYDPGFHQFSGYLTVNPDHGRRLFYWYVESQDNPSTSPLILWTNGGPGCSGLIGWGTEHGPYFISRNGTLSPNHFSWNRIASIFYVEQPARVGFSYSETKSDYTTGDDQAAQDNFRLMQEFLKRFPERRKNPFYIASESYGGHYMPQLTMEILKHNVDGAINFQGMIVGNPLVEPVTNLIARIQTFYYHGLLPRPLYQEWMTKCAFASTIQSKKCQKLEISMYVILGRKVNPYATDYPLCLEDKAQISRFDNRRQHRHLDVGASSQARHLLNSTLERGPPFFVEHDIYRPCAEEHMISYLNRPDVREAIHANPKVKTWNDCTSNPLHYNMHDIQKNLVGLYKELIKAAAKHGIQIVVFSGDDDAVCAQSGTQTWIYDLGVEPKQKEFWRSWEVDNQVAGFITKFDLGKDSKGSFTFATVHGAGHEVPAYRGREALELLRLVLQKDW